MKTTANNGMLAAAAAKQGTEVATQAEKPKTLQDLVEARKDQIARVLPSVLPPDQFTRLTLNALMTTKHLAECDMGTFYASVMTCAQLGLKPNVNGEGYLLPYFNNKQGRYNCQFIPGYKGLMMLARRSGEIASIDAQTVYENDVFELSYGFEPALIHKPLLTGDRGAVKGFYAAVIMKDGGKNAFYMSVDDAKKYGKKYSKSFNNGPWQTDFEAMAKKSCLRQVLKYCPCSSDVEKAIEVEDKYDDNYVDMSFLDPDAEIEQAEVVETAENDLNVNEDGEVVEE
jgi:recombination protein RecT